MKEYQAIFEQAPVALAEIDTNGQIQQVNARLAEMLGREAAELIGKTLGELTRSDATDGLEERVQEIISGKRQSWTGRYLLHRLNNSPHWVEISATRLTYGRNQIHANASESKESQSGNQLTGAVVSFQKLDATPEEQLDLEDNLRRLVTILDSTPDIVAMNTPEGETLYLNASGKRYFDIHDDQSQLSLEGQNRQCDPDGSQSPREQLQVAPPLAQAYPDWALKKITGQALPTALRDGYWQGETAIRDQQNNETPVSQVLIAHYNESGRLSHISTILRDVTEQKRLEKALAYEATTDHLTGIFNRQRFDTELDQAISRHNRYGNEIGLIMFDIDHFKVLNDTYGHDAGDRVLIELTVRVTENLRDPDVLARWGGEEFVIILPETDATGTQSLAERLRLDVAEHPFTGVGHITISLGATQIFDNDTPNSALKRVDNALYKAKRSGRNMVIYYP
ncbi:diguanylate cyclase/phosphodiesterase with PAS/PAC sensor [Halorhodospira halochloris]|uniref:diguanylate cyclase n=1 Tax=Halorhodospira halochloris TaxID=1052 RepID=A0A0X8X9C8_HALHR|nr:diguanylate cyclase [Halorhodospira halochloris]MBK1652641.1 hypothetical protein [Halorhodospira halochloris]MCG5548824.1 diguanylate cyclase [Halorhodospira halochloris]BAU57906.1 diguanylate cyclase/phosphodiesterase with PAS/PAC sensor [Halorhodospira halochloris]